jgi:tRNA-splicing ligase RtcB (3'-phosphate/5'-hydroxy nucleic acid ligase)
LGGGNHFLEIQRDQEGRVWVMLHSGSRYLGVTMRDYYVEQGEKQEGIDRRLFAKAPYLQARSRLADDYLADLRLVLDFARESRKEMMIRVLEVLSAVFSHTQGMSWQELIGTAYDIAHNYVGEEEHFGERLFVHRKGAICLAKGQIGLIPGSMGTCSYVVEGRGNSFGFNSCSHGAGRVMSRAEAFRVISDKDFNQSMEDVIHAHDPGMKDEAPAAYKDIHRVMRGQKGLVKVLHELNPLLSVKGR